MLHPRPFALLALLAALASCASASVPAILVNSRGASAASGNFAGLSSSRVGAQQLAEALRQAAAQPDSGLILLVTVDEGLALADFARFGGVDSIYSAGAGSSSSAFANIASLSAKLAGRHLLVADADKLLLALRSVDWHGGAPIDVANGDDVGRVVVDAAKAGAGASRLVIARAADVGAADRLLGAACAALQSHGLPFVAVFTATHESNVPADAVDAAASAGRHLLAAPTASPSSNGTFVNCSGSVLLYFATLEVKLTQSGKTHALPAVSPVADGDSLIDMSVSQCNAAGGNRTLALSFPGSALPKPMTGLKLTLNFIGDTRSSSGLWRIASGSASLTCSPGNCTSVPEAALTADSLARFSTPNGSCYHCTTGANFSTAGGAAGNSTTVLTLAFGKFQLQAFSVGASGKFSSQVNDCVGFFSVEVWFSLMVLLVVTVILMYGVLMLASVATPDRFDDPKGKTIQVNVQEGAN